MPPQKVSITPLLKRLWPLKHDVTATEIAAAVSLIFSDSLSPVQAGALLTALHFTGADSRADVLFKCAEAMRSVGAPVDAAELKAAIAARARDVVCGTYAGGLVSESSFLFRDIYIYIKTHTYGNQVDIVGTGGDSHNTYNVSTTASIIASAYVLIAKHGNRAMTSASGSADILVSPVLSTNLASLMSTASNTSPHSPPPTAVLTATTPTTISSLYTHTNYAFLYAPVFHTSIAHIGTLRRELGWRTIFNLLGPLTNPVHSTGCVEARIIGVARRDLGPAFAEAFALSGADKTVVVCGDEELDEISCAGITHCWAVRRTASIDKDSSTGDDESSSGTSTPTTTTTTTKPYTIDYFTISPTDFGLPTHPLSSVKPGGSPDDNAAILADILTNARPASDPILDFVLLNTAAVLAVAGVCDTDENEDKGDTITERGPGGYRWKDGVRRAREAVVSGKAARMWAGFAAATSGGIV